MGSDKERPFQGVVAESVAGAAIGFAFGGPAGAAAGGLVPLGERLVRLSQTEIFSREARAEAMWAIAGREAGTSRDSLLDAAERDVDRLHMGYSAGQAAATSRYPARVVALGRALAHGICSDDAAELDHWQLVIDAIAAVERPHLVVLSSFANIEGSAAAPVCPADLGLGAAQQAHSELGAFTSGVASGSRATGFSQSRVGGDVGV